MTMPKHMKKKRYLTNRVGSQRIGLTEGSMEDLKESCRLLETVSNISYSRSMIIRRALQVYRDALENLCCIDQLEAELQCLKDIQGKRGRPPIYPVSEFEEGI